MSKQIDNLTQWVATCSQAVDDYLELTTPFLLEQPSIDPKSQWVLKQLSISCNLSSESSLLLISYLRLWDAEMLLRSVMEGTVKYIYLCLGGTGELATKVDEFLEDLRNISKLKNHQRVSAFLAEVDDASLDEWAILRQVLIEDTEVDALRLRYPRQVAQRLQQKWSFNEMALTLAKTDGAAPGFESLQKLLTYSYGIGSHLIHQDANALELICDRNRQSSQELELVQLAHAARQMNDLMIMAHLRTVLTFKLHNADMKPVSNLFEEHKPLFAEWDALCQMWWSEQPKEAEREIYNDL